MYQCLPTPCPSIVIRKASGQQRNSFVCDRQDALFVGLRPYLTVAGSGSCLRLTVQQRNDLQWTQRLETLCNVFPRLAEPHEYAADDQLDQMPPLVSLADSR